MTIDLENPGWWIFAVALVSVAVTLGMKMNAISVLEKAVDDIRKAVQTIQNDVKAIVDRLPEPTTSSDSPPPVDEFRT